MRERDVSLKNCVLGAGSSSSFHSSSRSNRMFSKRLGVFSVAPLPLYGVRGSIKASFQHHTYVLSFRQLEKCANPLDTYRRSQSHRGGLLWLAKRTMW